MIQIEEFAGKLSAITEREFTLANVLNFLRANRVDSISLNPYLYFCQEKDHYTRNLIHKTELFELIAICWDIGQKSPIHNHRDQSCWMAVPYGKLQIHNFALVKKDPGTGFCELRSNGQVMMDPENPQQVDVEEPIHQVLNLPAFGSKAISLHIYSKPFDSCEVYELKEKRYRDIPLVNTSEYGVLKTDLPVVKIEL
jgi:predicted metal-dependent enzyme (double-stranded beta helix superfamily)